MIYELHKLHVHYMYNYMYIHELYVINIIPIIISVIISELSLWNTYVFLVKTKACISFEQEILLVYKGTEALEYKEDIYYFKRKQKHA